MAVLKVVSRKFHARNLKSERVANRLADKSNNTSVR